MSTCVIYTMDNEDRRLEELAAPLHPARYCLYIFKQIYYIFHSYIMLYF
jgi:hypothetical protein